MVRTFTGRSDEMKQTMKGGCHVAQRPITYLLGVVLKSSSFLFADPLQQEASNQPKIKSIMRRASLLTVFLCAISSCKREAWLCSRTTVSWLHLAPSSSSCSSSRKRLVLLWACQKPSPSPRPMTSVAVYSPAYLAAALLGSHHL